MEKKVNMLTYNFENIGSDTLYEYLYKCIKNDIIQGKIKSGEKLPSKRALAKNLAISVITVENAYGQLAAEGVFVGSGIFKSGNPAKRAAAIVQAVTNYTDAKLIAELSSDLGEAMVGINEQEIEIFS